MVSGWTLMFGVLTVILGQLAVVKSDHGLPHYCPTQYYVRASRQQYYTTSCGWWGRRCGRTRTYYVSEQRTNTKSCCAGYIGSSCNIPVCTNPACQNNAVCVAPNDCYCRPGSSGSGCALAFCSASNDCYPGTCLSNGANCKCASGFTGSSCSNMLEAGDFQSCEAKLETGVAGQTQTPFTGSCGTRDPEDYTYWSNTGNPDYIILNYNMLYNNPADLPPLPSEYMIQANFGLISSYTLASLKNQGGTLKTSVKTLACNIEVSSGQQPPSQGNPHQSMNCQNTKYNWISAISQTISHRDTLELEIVSQSGGFKKYRDPVTNVVTTRNYIGTTSSQFVHINFDLQAPKHCSETSACENDFMFPSAWMPDLTNLNSPTIVWFGWNDTDSGIKEYRYTIYSMEYIEANNKLKEVPDYWMQKTWISGEKTPQINFTVPGTYSVILEVVDNAGNIAKSRSILLYDDVSSVEVEDSNPISIAGIDKWQSAFWTTQPSNTPIQVTWENRFINRFHFNDKLLLPVEPMSGVIDDSSGNRTIQGINNIQGVVKFEATYNKDTSGGASATARTYVDLGLTQNYMISESRQDGDTVVVYIRAHDAIGNIKEEIITIHTDATAAVYNVGGSTFTKNADSQNNNEPYGSSLSLSILDINSGIRNVSFEMVDITTSIEVVVYTSVAMGQHHPAHTTKEQCVISGDCYCIPLGPCYTTSQLLWINHCRIKNLEGHSFRVDFTAFNGAGLPTTGSFSIDILDSLRGIGVYPKPIEVRVIDANQFGTKASIAWYYESACYNITGVKIVFVADTSTKEIQITPDKTTHELTELNPRTQYQVDIFVLYEGGIPSEPSTISFQTGDLQAGETSPGSNGGNGIGAIVGAVIGGIILLLLVAIVILLFVRYRQNKHPVPKIIRETTTRIHNRLSRFHPNDFEANRFNENQEQSGVHFNNNEYSEANAAHAKSAFNKQMALNVAYNVGEEDEDIYIYGNMETDPKAQWKVSDDRIVIGNPLHNAKGRFADLKLATLQDKNGKSTVVAKMNKASANEEDKLLMMAKMNFFATEVTKHAFLVNFIAAVPPPQGPILLFEYCSEGKLVDWLQNNQKITPDIEDNLVTFSIQVAEAMSHLHSQRILHRRLGARNILLKSTSANQLVAKVTGFGPMKGEQDGKDTSAKDKIPIKWMAPEQYEKTPGEKRVYTPETDVWSFGITLHEIFNMGEAPYPNMRSAEVKEKVKNGYRMPKGENCPDFIYNDTIMPCWDVSHHNRPDFDSIVQQMKNFYEGQPAGDIYYADEDELGVK